MRGRRISRIITRVIVFLLLGAIVNVAVAWGLAALPPTARPEKVALASHGRGRGAWHLVKQQVTAGRTQNLLLDDIVESAQQSVHLTNGGRTLTCTITPPLSSDDRTPWEMKYPVRTASWSRLSLVTVDEQRMILSEVAAGWPLRALWGCAQGRASLSYIRLGTYQRHAYADPQAIGLPLRPIFGGFAINTLFYAAMSWLICATTFALRRGLRIKRGLCPRCAYPIGASDVCTECGNSVVTRINSGVVNPS